MALMVDGARAAKFLDDVAKLIEAPWGAFAKRERGGARRQLLICWSQSC